MGVRELQEAHTRENVFPLLRVLAGRPDVDMRRAVAEVVACLAAAQGGFSLMPEREREVWTDTVRSCPSCA